MSKIQERVTAFLAKNGVDVAAIDAETDAAVRKMVADARRKYGTIKIEKIDGVWRMLMWRTANPSRKTDAEAHWMLLKDEFKTRREARQAEKESR